MITMNPYLAFPGGHCREAMTRYAEIFGGDLTVSTFGEFGDEGPSKDLVMHARFTSPEGFTLMASDTHEQMAVTQGDSISISLSGPDGETLTRWFGQLAEGGTVRMPLEKQMWGDVYGDLQDRFGVHWMVNITQE